MLFDTLAFVFVNNTSINISRNQSLTLRKCIGLLLIEISILQVSSLRVGLFFSLEHCRLLFCLRLQCIFIYFIPLHSLPYCTTDLHYWIVLLDCATDFNWTHCFEPHPDQFSEQCNSLLLTID